MNLEFSNNTFQELPDYPLTRPGWFDHKSIADGVGSMFALCALLNMHIASIRWVLHCVPDAMSASDAESVATQCLADLDDLISASDALLTSVECMITRNPILGDIPSVSMGGELMIESGDHLEQLLSHCQALE